MCAVAIARPLVGHRTKRGHDRLRRGWHPEPALIVPLDPQRPVVQTLRPGPENLATRSRSLEHEAPPPRMRRAQMQGAHDRLRSDPPAPPQRGKHETSMDGDGEDCDTGIGSLLRVDADTGSYPLLVGRSGPTSILASRDKIRPSQPRLSPISPKGHRRQIQNLNKSRAYQRHVSAMPDLHPRYRQRTTTPTASIVEFASQCFKRA